MADALVDMAYTKAELKEEKKEMSVGYNGQPSAYPWGLCIRLEANELEKLGMTQLPAIGELIHLQAVAKVTSVSQSATEDRDEQRCVSLQITMLQVVAAPAVDSGAAKPASAGGASTLTSKYKG